MINLKPIIQKITLDFFENPNMEENLLNKFNHILARFFQSNWNKLNYVDIICIIFLFALIFFYFSENKRILFLVIYLI